MCEPDRFDPLSHNRKGEFLRDCKGHLRALRLQDPACQSSDSLFPILPIGPERRKGSLLAMKSSSGSGLQSIDCLCDCNLHLIKDKVYITKCNINFTRCGRNNPHENPFQRRITNETTEDQLQGTRCPHDSRVNNRARHEPGQCGNRTRPLRKSCRVACGCPGSPSRSEQHAAGSPAPDRPCKPQPAGCRRKPGTSRYCSREHNCSGPVADGLSQRPPGYSSNRSPATRIQQDPSPMHSTAPSRRPVSRPA